MFNVNAKEFIFLVMVALVVLGPEKLPEVFRRAGRLYSEVRRASDSFQAEFQRAIEEPIKQVNESRDLVRESLDFRPTDRSGPNDGTIDDSPVDDDTIGDDTVDDDTVDDDSGADERDQVGGDAAATPDGDQAEKPVSEAVAVPADPFDGDEERAAQDQAEVERRIAAMELANPPAFESELDDPGPNLGSQAAANGGEKGEPS